MDFVRSFVRDQTVEILVSEMPFLCHAFLLWGEYIFGKNIFFLSFRAELVAVIIVVVVVFVSVVVVVFADDDL